MTKDDSGQVPHYCAARGPIDIQESLSHLAGYVLWHTSLCFWPQANEGWVSLPTRPISMMDSLKGLRSRYVWVLSK